MVKLGNDWDEILQLEYKKDYFFKLFNYLEKEYKNKIIYPHYNNIFQALKLTPYKKVKVLILGQDLIMVRIKLMGWFFLFSTM